MDEQEDQEELRLKLTYMAPCYLSVGAFMVGSGYWAEETNSDGALEPMETI